MDKLQRTPTSIPAPPSAEPPPDVDGLIARLNGIRVDDDTGYGLAREAAAALAALAKERDDLLNAAGSVVGSLTDDAYEAIKAAEQRAEQAERDLAEARENAERYRKLKAEGGSITMTNGYVFGLEAADTTIDSWGGCPHGFNKKHNCPLCIMPAIDAARKGEK